MFENDQESFGDFLTRTSGSSGQSPSTASQGFGDFLRKPKKKAPPEIDPYGPEVPDHATAPPIEKPANRPVALKPLTSREMRHRDAAMVIRKIEAGRQRAVSLFQEADRTPERFDTISVPTDRGAFGLKDSTGQRLTERKTLRARAEGELETANRLGEEAAKKYGDIIEVGFGTDKDPKSNRRWVYAKPKNANVEFWRKPSLEEQAAGATREDIDREIKQQKEIQSRKREFEDSGTLGQYAQKLATRYLSGRPDLTPEEREELAIRRQAEGVGVDRQGQPLSGVEEPGFVRDWMNRGSRALLDTIPSAASGLAHLSDTVYRQAQNLAGNRLPDAADWGPATEKWAREVSSTLAPTMPTDPARNEDFSSKLASGVGSAAGFGTISKLASFARIPSQIAIGTAGAGLGADEIIQDARAAGFDPARDPDRWDRMVALGGAAGMTEIFGFGKMLDNWGLKRPFIKRSLEILEEFGQEGFQQYLGNVNAAYVGQYDPNRPWSKDVLENAVIGGIIGSGAQVAEMGSEARRRRAEARAVAKEPLQPLSLQPSVPQGTDTQVIKVNPGFLRRAAGLPELAAGAPATTQPVTPATVQAPTIPTTVEPITSAATPTTAQPSAPLAPLFPEAQQQAPQVDVSTLPPQQRVAALVDQLRQQQQGRARAGLEQSLNQEFIEAGGMVSAAAEAWDADRATAEQLAATGASRLKNSLQNLQKSEAYQAELAAVASGSAQPGPYMAAGRAIQQQLDQVDSLYRLDAERERVARERQSEAERLQKKSEKTQKQAEKTAAKQELVTSREQQKLQRQLEVEQKRNEAAAKRLATAEAAKEKRRLQLKQQREQTRNEQVRKQADAELQRLAQYDAALKAADVAGARHQQFINQGQIAEAINELVVQQNQLRDAVRYLPKTPESQNTKADLNRYQGQIGNRIGDLKQQMRGRSVPVTRPVPPLFRPDAVVNPEGGVPEQESFYAPGAIFDRQTLEDVDQTETPLLTAIRQMGGIRDDRITGGELRRLGVKESGTTGIVNNKTGLAPDRMREALAESGYLPQDSTVDDLYQAVEAAIRAMRAGSHPKESFGDFYERQAENETPEARESFASFVEQSGDEVDAEDMAALRRAQQRSEAENPRDYDERTRPGEPGSGGVSFSPYGVLSARNREAENQLYNSLPGSPEFKEAERVIYRDAKEQGIAERHAGAMIAYALNYHGEKTRLQEQGLDLDEMQAAQFDGIIEALTEQKRKIDERIRIETEGLLGNEADWVDMQIRAIDELFSTVNADPDMIALLDDAVTGDQQQVEDFAYAAGYAYGFDADLARQFVERQRRRAGREETGSRVGDRPTEAEYRSEEDSAFNRPREEEARERVNQPRNLSAKETELVRRNLDRIPDSEFDSYLQELEKLQQLSVQGYEFGGISLTESANKAIRARYLDAKNERRARVKANRLPSRQNFEAIEQHKNYSVQQLAELSESRPGRKSRLSVLDDAVRIVLKKRPSGVPAKWLTEVERLSDKIAQTKAQSKAERPGEKSAAVKMMLTRDDRQQLADLGYARSEIDAMSPDEGASIISSGKTKAREAATVTHSDPAIDGKPILAKTDDGRVIVENAGNKSGISVVKDQTDYERELESLKGNKSFKDIAERENNAIQGMIETIMNLGDMSREDAEKAYDKYEGLKRFDYKDVPNGGQMRVKHGSYLDRSELRKAAGLDVETAKGSEPKSERGRLAIAVADFLATGRFGSIIDARKFIGNITGQKIQPGTVEAKKVDEAIEAGGVIAAMRIVDQGLPPRETFRALLDLHNRLPNLNMRTSTSVLQQAYSTPLPLGYVAAQLAGISRSKTVYEPTAGHGSLLITADSAKVTANELNDDRNAALFDILPEAEITQHDASGWRPNVQVDRVIANPPFGPVKDDNGKSRRFDIDGKYETSEIDHAIAFEALKAMKNNGRAVLIVAGLRAETEGARSNGYNVEAKRNFYFTLYNQYNVVDHFTVAGDLFAKQGAGFPVDVIVIDGRGKATRSLPAVEVPQILRTWDELEGKLNVRGSRQTSAEVAAENVRLGERGLSDSQRDSRAAERAADQPGLFGVPSGQSREDASRRDVGTRGTGVSGGATVQGQPARADSRTQRPETGTQRDNIQQSATGRAIEPVERVPGQGDAQQRQRAREADRRRNQPGAVDQRADRGTGRASFVAQSATKNSFGWQIDAKTEDGGETAVLTAYNFNTGREQRLTFSPANYEGTVKSGGSLLDGLNLQGKYSKDERLQFSSVIADVVVSLNKEIAQKQAEVTEETPSPSDVNAIFDESFEALFGSPPVQSETKPKERPSRKGTDYEVTSEAESQRTTKEAATSAVKESTDTLKEIAKGLSELFGGPKVSTGLTFDEKTYAAAKPHFELAMAHFRQATTDVREVMTNLLRELNQRFGFQPDVLQRMKPYIVRFVEEQTAAPQTKEQNITKTITAPSATASQADAGASDTHRAYKPSSRQASVNTLVPVNMANAVENSLKRLQEEVGDLDDFVADRLGYDAKELGKYFSGEQVDAVAMAVRNIENGGALILGDQTGIGKGRVVAGVIRYAIKKGITPVFVTEKPTLYGDMIRDLADIGSANVKPLVTNSGESVPLDDEALEWYGAAEKAKLEGRPAPAKRGRFLQTKSGEAHSGLLSRAAETGNLGEYKVIFTTYNQMQSVQGKTGARHELLRRFANGGIVIFDESHNAGGTGKVETDKRGEPKFDRAQFARQLAKNAKGVLYSSATFAKRPEVMDLYFRTELGNAVGDLEELAEITRKGGVPMQQVIASMLAEAGQYIRRERSFNGVEYSPTPVKVDRKSAENISRAMRVVADFDLIKQDAVKTLSERVKAEAKRITGDGTVGQAGVSSVNFTSLMHNLIDQSLLALKVNEAADMAIVALERGEKPVITVANTMGSFIQRYAEEMELQPGAPINLSFNDLLARYLERSREVIVGKPYGEKSRHYLSDEELGEAGLRAYESAKEFLESINLDIPISPIDWLHKRLRDAGYRTSEITGRNHIINYTSDGPVYGTRPASEISTAAKKRTISAFNDGTMDVVILNQSGSTGISLHASEKFKDQRRRHMIIAQAEKNIDTHMQMLGRVHRTGQVIPPRYTQMVADVPAELRPAAVLGKKMASLNANTTASRSSAVTSKDTPDFLNKYGDEVAASLMESDPDLHAALGRPLKDSERSDGLEREDAMRRVTGRIPLLPIAEQEKVYDLLIDEYNDALQQAEAMGENALEAKTLDLQAETTKTQTMVPESGKSIFEQATNLEKIRSNRQGKPFASSEVIEKLQASLETDSGDLQNLQRSGARKIRAMRGELEAEVAAYKNKIDEEHGDSKRGAVENLAADKWLNRWNQITGTVYPGATVQLAGGYGVVLSVERKGKRANPVALSGWRATIALTDSRRQLQVPFSKIDFESSDQPNRVPILPAMSAIVYDPAKEDFASVPIIEAFDKGLSSTKETRYIVTGNLIAGFAAQPNGQIVNFTDNENRIRQGILMPVKFDPADVAAKRKEKLKSVDAVMSVLDDRARGAVTDRSDNLTIQAGLRGGYVFSVPSAKGRGGVYYLNKALIRAAGNDFVKRGGLMEVQVSEAAARRMIDVLLKGEGMPSGIVLQARPQSDTSGAGGIKVNQLALDEAGDLKKQWGILREFDAGNLEGAIENARIEISSDPANPRAGILYINGNAKTVIQTIWEGAGGARLMDAVALDPDALQTFAEVIRYEAGFVEGRTASQLNALADAFDQAAKDSDGAALINVSAAERELQELARNHELFHIWQYGYDQPNNPDRQPMDVEWASAIKGYDRVRRDLLRRGYPDDPEDIVREFAAYAATDDLQRLGFSPQEARTIATDFLYNYFSEVAKQYGSEHLARIGRVSLAARSTIERVQSEKTPQRTTSGTASKNRGGQSQASSAKRIAVAGGSFSERNERGREKTGNRESSTQQGFSFGRLEFEPSGPALGGGFGSQAFFDRQSRPKTTPLREIIAEHQPLIADPIKIQDKTLDEIVNAAGRGVAGSLPGARAIYWANKLRMKGVADRLANRQADYLSSLIEKTNEVIALSDRLAATSRGTKEYEKTREQLDKLRVKIAGQLSRAAEYTPAAGYLARIYKSSLLSAPHIHLFNMLEQVFKLPLHEAQRAADLLVPAKILNKYGIPYNKAVTDFRDLVPAIESEIRGLGSGLKEVSRDVIDMFRYGVTRQMIKADDAEGGFESSTDKFELGHRAKGIPGLDQVLNFVGRSHGAADITFSNIVNATAIAAQANAIARKVKKQNSLTKEEAAKLARDLAYEPSAMMVALADDATLRFKLDYPTLAYDLLQKIRNLPAGYMGEAAEKGIGKAVDSTWKAAMDFIVPFSKIPLAAVDTYLFRYSPVAFARVAGRLAMSGKSDYTGRYKGVFAKERFGEDTAELFRQGLIGSLSWALLGALGSLGYLQFSGGREDDDDRRNVSNLRETMGVDYGPEVRAGDYAFNLNRMGPVGQAAGIGARIYQAQQQRINPKTGERDDLTKRAGRTVKAAKEGLLFNNPLGQAVKDIAGDETHSTQVGQFVGGKLRGFVPGFARDIAKIQTPTKKLPEETTTMGRLKSDIRSGMPVDLGFGSRAQMTDRVDVLGRPVPERNPFTFWRQIERDPQREEMERLNVGLPKPKREKWETAAEYNRRITGYVDPATGERVRGQADDLKDAMLRIAADSRQTGRSNEAKARIYSTELTPGVMKRTAKLSAESVEIEREIEAIRADTYEALRKLPAYQQMKEPGKDAARSYIDEQLKGYRARAASSRSREKAARLPEFDPVMLAQMAISSR